MHHYHLFHCWTFLQQEQFLAVVQQLFTESQPWLAVQRHSLGHEIYIISVQVCSSVSYNHIHHFLLYHIINLSTYV